MGKEYAIQIANSIFEPSLRSDNPRQKKLASSITAAIEGLINLYGNSALDLSTLEKFRVNAFPDYEHPAGFSFIHSKRIIRSIDGRIENVDIIKSKIMQILILNEGLEVPDKLMFEYVWGSEDFADSKTLSTHLSVIRRKIYPTNQRPLPHKDQIILRRQNTSTTRLSNQLG